MITARRLIWSSLRYHWRTNGAVALGVAAATAVITGALIVGDSVRGSLRHLTLDRLGRIDEVLVTDRFFRQALANEYRESSKFSSSTRPTVVPATLLPSATAEGHRADGHADDGHTSDRSMRRASDVFVVGCTPEFWTLDPRAPASVSALGADQVVVNEPLARELGVGVGDEITIRLPDASQIPADSTLGQKSNRVRSLPRLRVASVLPAEGLGRFGLRPNQGLPRNAYVALSTLQQTLDETERVNALLVAFPPGARNVEGALRPTLSDLGLKVERIQRLFGTDEATPKRVIYNYYSLTTDRMILSPAVSADALALLEPFGAQEVLTYLADSIQRVPTSPSGDGGREIPYSIVTGIDSSPEFPLLPAGQVLGDDEIVLHEWAARRLEAAVGDRIRLSYFEPETAHGENRRSHSEFTLRAVVPLTEPAQPYRGNRPAQFQSQPVIFNDPDLTPVVKGITDQDSIEDWEAPFPFDIRRMQPVDDEYWKNHRTTPKAYVSLATAQRLWGSRFGQATSLRIPMREATDVRDLEQALLAGFASRGTSQALGFEFQPVKQAGLQASRGTTPFDALFLGLSFFVIVSAVLLVALLFRLGVEQRANQLGVLAALGFARRRARALFLAEGAAVAGFGAVLGVAVGVGYAWLMLAGLRSERWWLGAISSPFLSLFITPTSLVVGYLSGVLVSIAAIYLGVRRLRHTPTRQLLAGDAGGNEVLNPVRQKRWLAGSLFCILAACGLGGAAVRLSGEAQAGAFVGGGFLVLLALLLLQWTRLRAGSHRRISTLLRLAASSAARNPTRSVLTVGLMSSAAFLIVSMSAFRVSPSLEGAGGFSLLAQSALPIYANLNQARTRQELLGPRSADLQGVEVFSFRVQPGDDASCRNLYKVTQPQVYGVPRAFATYFDDPQRTGFAWGGSAARSAPALTNPWHLLWEEDAAGTIPVIVDKNTALYSLHWTGGIGAEYSLTYAENRTLRFRVVGLLSNSVLQGTLLISEQQFERAFSNINGYRFFLIAAVPQQADTAAQALEGALSDQGFDTRNTQEVLSGLLAVQNTYLSTFQSLGALGLLLGTLGVATVQARSVLERRRELALLRAAGFARRRVGWLVLLENLALLLGGLAAGTLAALSAVLPHIFLGGARIPLVGVLQLLLVVLTIGVISSVLTTRFTLRGALLPSLRGE